MGFHITHSLSHTIYHCHNYTHGHSAKLTAAAEVMPLHFLIYSYSSTGAHLKRFEGGSQIYIYTPPFQGRF